MPGPELHQSALAQQDTVHKSVTECDDVYSACNDLIKKANDAGGTDNISVALIKL